jgi:DNA invertase Pin-like site-specific DNA recombinase
MATSFGTPEQRGNVTIYPALPAEMLRAARGGKAKVAAYVRVSTDSVQQETSLALQKEYYEKFFKNNSEYEFVGIYEDDGVSATSTDKRKGFLKLIEDSKAGKIDLILTKSISRFARNVGDLLKSINDLNALNPPVEVRFEMENISTFSPMGEMLITLLGILAQWESQIKSEAITWAIDRLFKQGKYYVFPLLGYDKEKGRDNPLTINEKEAKTVRLCYALTVMGYSFTEIAKTMNALGLKSRLGNVRWTASGVISLLSNEKYVGELIARKTVTPNYKTHKSKKNEGEKDKYRVENHHEPIVPQLAREVALKIKNNRRGGANGIPYLKTVPEGILKSFISVDKNVRGYTLDDYEAASRSLCEDEDDTEICIFADKVCKFDLRTHDTVSTLFFDEHTKSACSIKENTITFNAACRKSFMILHTE